MIKKSEVKETVEKKFVSEIPSGPEIVAKHRDDSGIIQCFKTKSGEEFSISELVIKINDGDTIVAKDRSGKLSKVKTTEDNDLGVGKSNLGHLPDY